MADGTDGIVSVGVELDPTKAESQADQIGKSLGEQVKAGVDGAAKEASSAVSQSMGQIGSSMQSFGSSYSKAVTLPILGAAAATGAATIQIDTALTGVRKTVDGTEEDYQRLKDAAIDFSKTNAVDASTILDIQALGAQLGYSINELEMFGETVSGLDIATNLSAEEAATELAQFANIMGMAHSETQNYGSTIVELGNNFATTEADISHMSMRIAGAGNQIGLSEADVLGLATALSSMGIEAEAGGTAISTIMSSIDTDVALGTANLQTWAETAGMSVDQFSKAWGEDAVGALSAVLVGMDAVTKEGGNMSVMLDELGIKSIRQTDLFKRLASNPQFIGEAVATANRAWEENTALCNEVENFNNSIAGQLEQLKNRVIAIATELGEPLMSAVLALIDSAQPLIDALASGAKAFGDLDEDAQRTIITVVALVAAFGPATSLMGKITSAAAASAGQWQQFNTALKTVASGVLKATDAMVKGNGTMLAYKSSTVAGSTAFYALDKATGQYVRTNKTLKTALMGSTAGMKAQEAAQKGANIAMTAGRAAANLLGTALKAIAPIAVITAVIQIVDAFNKGAEEAETFEQATTGLENATSAYADAVKGASDGTEEYKQSLRDVANANDELHKSTADLAQSIQDTWSEVGTNNSLVDKYTDTIEQLTQKHDEFGNRVQLTAQEQGELQAAVEGLNSVCGTSYEVIDALNGEINTSTDVINANSEAWKANAKVQAEQENLKDLYKQQAEIKAKMKETNIALAESEEKVTFAIGDFAIATEDNRFVIADLKKDQEQYRGELKAVNKSISVHEEMLAQDSAAAEANQAAVDQAAEAAQQQAEAAEQAAAAIDVVSQVTEEAVESVNKAAEESSNFNAAMADMGYTSEEMAAALDIAGISASDLSSTMDNMADQTANAFERIKGASDISLEEMQKNLEANAETTSNWSDDVQTLYDRAGSSIETDFVAYLASLGPEYADQLDQLVNATPEKLTEMASAWNEGLESAREGAVTATQANNDAVVEAIGESREAQKTAAAEAAQGQAEGIEEAGSTATTAAETTANNVVNSGTSVLSGARPLYSTAASTAFGGVTDAVGSSTGNMTTAVTTIATTGATTLSGSAPLYNASGKALGEAAAEGAASTAPAHTAAGQTNINAYTTGEESAKPAAVTAATGVANDTATALNSAAAGATAAGRNVIQGFINGANGMRASVVASFASLAQAALQSMKSALDIHSPSKKAEKEVGKNLALGVANGIKKNTKEGTKSAANYAKEIVSAAKTKLSDYKKVNDMTLKQEQAFWKQIMKEVKKGTEGYKTAYQNYQVAHKKALDEAAKAEETYQKTVKKIQDQLIKDIQEANDEYNKAVEDRKNSILSGFSLFESFERGEKVDPTSLRWNMRTQADAAEEYADEMEKLKKRIGEGTLYSEIAEQGMDALEAIKAINQMSDYQVREFIKDYERRNAAAQKTAVAENETLKKETDKTIKSLTTSANKEIKAAAKELKSTVADLGVSTAKTMETMSAKITSIVKKMTTVIQKSTASVKSLGKAVTSAGTTTTGKAATTRTAYDDNGNARGIMVARDMISPMSQTSATIGTSYANVGMRTVASDDKPTQITNTTEQTLNIYQPVKSPSEVAREMRMMQTYGLAGDRK